MSMDRIDRIIDKYECETGVLIQLLLDIQHELNWIPPEAIIRINKSTILLLNSIKAFAIIKATNGNIGIVKRDSRT